MLSYPVSRYNRHTCNGIACRNKVIKLMEIQTKESKAALNNLGVTYNDFGDLTEKHEDGRQIKNLKS